MTRRDIPQQWKPLLETFGIHSARTLAERLEVAPTTATRLLHGESTSADTIEAAAELLKVNTAKIRELRGEVELPPFRLPPEADQLTSKQRTAIVAVVRAMLDPGNAAGDAAELSALDGQMRADLRAGRKQRRKGGGNVGSAS